MVGTDSVDLTGTPEIKDTKGASWDWQGYAKDFWEFDGNNVIEMTEYERRGLKKLRKRSKALAKLEEELREGLKAADGLMEDMHNCFEKAFAHSRDWIPSRLELNRKILEQLRSTSEFRKLRHMTVNDEMASIMATLAMGGDMKRAVHEEVRKAQENVESAESSLEVALEKLKNANNKAEEDPDDPGKQQKLEDALNQAQQKKQQKDQAAKKLGQKISEHLTQIRGQVRAGAKKALQEAQEWADAVEIFGGYGQGDGSGIDVGDVEEQLAFAKKIKDSRDLQEALSKVGAFRNKALTVRERKIAGRGVAVIDVKFGGDITKALPSELGKLDTEMEDDLYINLMQGTVLNYETESMEEETLGALVFCVDRSGSMAGLRNQWATAFVLASLLIAQKDKRHFYVINFSDSPKDMHLFDLTKAGPKEVIEYALSRHGGGGTDFDLPLAKSLEVIRKIKEFDRADIVFLTDGEAPVNKKQALLKEMHKMKVLLHVFYIERATGGYSYGPHYKDLDDMAKSLGSPVYDIGKMQLTGEDTSAVEDTFRQV
jgi:uncharacterized protein with von Willebrand factor type A (vWA) domain